MRRVAGILVLVCASVSCVLSIFYVNVSYLNLSAYAEGLERQPFQRRILLVPFVRWAESNHVLQTLASRFGQNVPQIEPMSAAKLGCILLSIVMLVGFGYWTTLASKRLSILHSWLIWTLILIILYVSYGSRYEQSLWYPYDIPHVVLFGVGTVLILTDQSIAFLPVLLVDAFARETSLYLIILAIAIQLKSTRWRSVCALSVLLWILARAVAYYLYPTGAHQWNGLHWYTMLKPWHLPQILSIVGYTWLPVWLSWRYFDAKQRRALVVATALMIATFPFATWNETRVWSEWTTLFAVLAAVAIERAFAQIPSTLRDGILSN